VSGEQGAVELPRPILDEKSGLDLR